MSFQELRGLTAAALVACVLVNSNLGAQQWLHDDGTETNRSIFRLLDEWPDPNDYRNAAGLPGPRYWQQRADYVIDVALDTAAHVVTGSERITYTNNSPDVLRYLWIQLDQNTRSLEHSRVYRMRGAISEGVSPGALELLGLDFFDGGDRLTRVQLARADGLLVDADYRVNGTVMRVELEAALEPGGSQALEIDWSFAVHVNGPRGGRELVNDGWIYEIAQWFPRMSVYDDVNGWQTDQFLGQGEFYLEFGDYDVRITVPHDHIVDASGVLQNPEAVLTATQRQRLARAYGSEEPVMVITADEVMSPAARPPGQAPLTWHFKAENVRDFAWVSSRTYAWDAAGFTYRDGDTPIMVHSLYPRDAMPLWDRVSTRATIQTLKSYGRLAFEYPYPKVVNANGPAGGMEYPMIAFCGYRPQPDGSYSDAVERSLISVTIHEVGHNWFPMIVATDERKWTWMDEGMNTFLQHYGEKDYAQSYCGGAWTQTADCAFLGPEVDPEDQLAYQRDAARSSTIVGYMRDPDQVPLMTESDIIHREFMNNGYAKPATGLTMLREHILGEESFDDAFSGYAQAWMFKKPQPADFFRSMEEGAGEHLAWFWRGWFYTTHANDQAVDDVTSQAAAELIGDDSRGRFYHRVKVDNRGGLVMPLELEVTYEDGTSERIDLPVDVWRNNELTFTVGFFADQGIVEVVLDPDEAYADIDPSNNRWQRPIA